MKKIISFFQNLYELLRDIHRSCEHIHFLLADIRNKITEVEIKD